MEVEVESDCKWAGEEEGGCCGAMVDKCDAFGGSWNGARERGGEDIACVSEREREEGKKEKRGGKEKYGGVEKRIVCTGVYRIAFGVVQVVVSVNRTTVCFSSVIFVILVDLHFVAIVSFRHRPTSSHRHH